MVINILKEKFELMTPLLNERSLRQFAAVEAKTIGRGGISQVSEASGLNRNTISRGIKELKNKKKLDPSRIRKDGAGRKKAIEKDITLEKDLAKIINPHTRGDPESPLRWTTKSLRNITKQLKKKKHKISHTLIADILHEMKYSLQANSKTKEGKNHPDRNKQFEYISKKAQYQLEKGEPIISIDAKKKELIGDFKNGGREWRPKGTPEEVRVYDFIIKELGKVCPYGVYDLALNKGWINLGISSDTAQFAVESIRQWWRKHGKKDYSKAKSIILTADCGGSNGVRIRLWKSELQKLANQTELTITVLHYPPGTSKWNKIEHKLFSFISKNWRAKPLVSHKVVINLIKSTSTETGLRVDCRLDKRKYKKGIKISDEELKKINIERHEFHPDWNYTIKPQR